METYAAFYWNTDIAMKFAFILVGFFNVPSVAVVTYCYYKHPENVNMMQNQSCITSKIHLNDNLISTDYNSSLITQSMPGADLNNKGPAESHVEMCVVFRFIVKQNLSAMVTSRSSSISFECDLKNWCFGKNEGLHTNVTVEGHTGDLYCCSTDNCNTESVMPQLPPPQICYKNTHHWGQQAGTYTLCKDPDSWCIRTRLLNATRPVTVYNCDNEHRCQHYNMTIGSSSSSLVCRNVSQAKGKEELCCCSGQKCFARSLMSTATAFGTPYAKEQRAKLSSGLSTVAVGCIVVFSILALAGGIVMIGLMYQRRSLPDSSSLTLTYSRIEDDDASDSIQML